MKKLLIILTLLTTQIFAETKNDNQKIFTAIKGNNVDYISLLIKNKANLSEIFDDESTYNPLDYAIINNKLKIVKLLVEYGLEIEPKNDYIKNVPDFFWNDEEFLLKLFKKVNININKLPSSIRNFLNFHNVNDGIYEFLLNESLNQKTDNKQVKTKKIKI